ncbi:MAG: hypothetical protein R2834_21720 [Rhodothermales bacterium]
MKNPVEALLEWYDHIQQDHRAEIASLIFSRLPNLEYEVKEEVVESDFRIWLTEETKTERIIGQLLTVRGLIGYLMEVRGNPLSWNYSMDAFLGVLNDDDENERSKGYARDRLLELPKQKGEWLETAATWRKLNRQVLSDKALHDWERLNIMQESI